MSFADEENERERTNLNNECEKKVLKTLGPREPYLLLSTGTVLDLQLTYDNILAT